MHLKDWREKKKGLGLFGKNGPLRFITATQLCPLIWSIILALLLMFALVVTNAPAFPPLTANMAFWSHSVVLSAFVGLFLLYKTTTADPGECHVMRHPFNAVKSSSY